MRKNYACAKESFKKGMKKEVCSILMTVIIFLRVWKIVANVRIVNHQKEKKARFSLKENKKYVSYMKKSFI